LTSKETGAQKGGMTQAYRRGGGTKGKQTPVLKSIGEKKNLKLGPGGKRRNDRMITLKTGKKEKWE